MDVWVLLFKFRCHLCKGSMERLDGRAWAAIFTSKQRCPKILVSFISLSYYISTFCGRVNLQTFLKTNRYPTMLVQVYSFSKSVGIWTKCESVVFHRRPDRPNWSPQFETVRKEPRFIVWEESAEFLFSEWPTLTTHGQLPRARAIGNQILLHCDWLLERARIRT